MFSKIKGVKNKFKRYYSRRSSDTWLDYLRSTGARIGEGTVIHANPAFVQIDTTRPWLIEIGKNVQLTNGVKILTHGYDWCVIKAVYGEVYGSSGKVKIGDNCFIGMNAVILKGTQLGNNVIVGAGSLVTGGTFPDNCVIAGNPARVICTLEEYRKKRIDAQLAEAEELVREYYSVYGEKPPRSALSEFFMLFEERREPDNPAIKYQMKNIMITPYKNFLKASLPLKAMTHLLSIA